MLRGGRQFGISDLYRPWSSLTAIYAMEMLGENPNLISNEDFRAQALSFYTPDGQTFLHYAVEKGATNVVCTLVAFGFFVDHIDDKGQTPLHLAAKNGYTDIVEVLLRAGADIFVKDSEDYTPLQLAAKNGRIGVVNQLIAYGDNLEVIAPSEILSKEFKQIALETDRHKALIAAAKCGQETIVDRLIEIGTTTEPAKHDETSALEEAAKNNRTSVALKLLECKHHNPERHKQALMYATKKNNEILVRKLLARGHNVNINPDASVSAVDDAIQNKNLAITHLLLRNGGVPRMPTVDQLNFFVSHDCDQNNPEVLICLIILCHQYQKTIKQLSADMEPSNVAQHVSMQKNLAKLGAELSRPLSSKDARRLANQYNDLSNKIQSQKKLWQSIQKKQPELYNRAIDSIEDFLQLQTHRDLLLKSHGLQNYFKTINKNVLDEPKQSAAFAELKAQIFFNNHTWPTQQPEHLSAEENFAFHEQITGLNPTELTPLSGCFFDNNFYQARMLEHLKKAALQGHHEARAFLHDRMAETKDEKCYDFMLIDEPQPLNPSNQLDSKHVQHQPAGLQPLEAKHAAETKEKPDQLPPDLEKRCSEKITILHRRHAFLKECGWDTLNNIMKIAIDYLAIRKRETGKTFFGYSQADYNTRLRIMQKLARLKYAAERYSSPQEIKEKIDEFMQHIHTQIPNVNRGWRSQRFATILQSLNDAALKIKTALNKMPPSPEAKQSNSPRPHK